MNDSGIERYPSSGTLTIELQGVQGGGIQLSQHHACHDACHIIFCFVLA